MKKIINEIIDWLPIIVAIAIVSFIFWYNINIWINCEGATIRGAVSFECIDSKLLENHTND